MRPVAEALAPWNDGPAKARIVGFVEAVTRSDGPDHVPPAERVAVFDNDGTLWAEQPAYVQAFFVADRVQAMAATRPDWKTREPTRRCFAATCARSLPAARRRSR